ncbi:SHOCT domain-containing protein [Kitasatospora aureofaciens]|uniref:SHOCT domain-containing protein n=1 Tax=Kitasatospora aureofaciens TaxID=1894 RepID=UPI0036F45AB7
MYTQLADWHGPGAWILLVPLFWIAVVVLVITLLRRSVRRRYGARGFGAGVGAGAPGVVEHPLAVLGRRFAEGDIDAEEYRAKRAVLTEPTKDVPGGGGAR